MIELIARIIKAKSILELDAILLFAGDYDFTDRDMSIFEAAFKAKLEELKNET